MRFWSREGSVQMPHHNIFTHIFADMRSESGGNERENYIVGDQILTRKTGDAVSGTVDMQPDEWEDDEIYDIAKKPDQNSDAVHQNTLYVVSENAIVFAHINLRP